MKMPLKWHEECLQGRFDTYVRLRQKADEAVEDADRCQAECAFYARQIGEARARGKDGFDAERFLVKRGRKEPGGLGLNLIKDFIRMNEGKLQIVSRFGYYEFSSRGDSFNKMDHDFPGTCINIEINTQDTSSYCLKSELSSDDIF